MTKDCFIDGNQYYSSIVSNNKKYNIKDNYIFKEFHSMFYMGDKKRDTNLGFFGVFSNLTHHSYTYNKKYNAFWRSFALQLMSCLNKKQDEEIAERRL